MRLGVIYFSSKAIKESMDISPKKWTDFDWWVKDLVENGFTVKCVMEITNSTKKAVQLAQARTKAKKPPNQYVNKRLPITIEKNPAKQDPVKKRVDWDLFHEGLKSAKAEIFGEGEALPEPERIPKGFQEMCQWLEPYGTEVDEVFFIIKCRGITIRYISFYWDSTAVSDNLVKDLRRWALKQKDYILIYEDEWRDKKDLVQWVVGYRLKIVNDLEYLDARKLTPRVVSYKPTYRKFLDENHLEGMPVTKRASYFKKTWALGLFDQNDRMVACGMVWYRKNDLELVRYCTLKGTCVRGGFSRIIKAFERAMGRLYIVFSVRLGNPKCMEMIGYKNITTSYNFDRRYWVTDLEKRMEERGIIRCLTPEDKAQFPTIPNRIAAYGRAGIYSWKLWGTRKPLFFFQHLGFWHYANLRDPDNPNGLLSGGSSP